MQISLFQSGSRSIIPGFEKEQEATKVWEKNFLHFSFVTLCDNFMSPKEVVKVSSGKIHFMLEWLKIYDSTNIFEHFEDIFVTLSPISCIDYHSI